MWFPGEQWQCDPNRRQEEWQDSPDGWPQGPAYSRWASSPEIAALYGREDRPRSTDRRPAVVNV